MRTRWRRCVAVILTTGSISSTYGANSAAPACLAEPPTDAAQLIAELALEPGDKLGYREVVSHPALAEPEVATGTVFVAEDGALVRDQVTPRRQISEIGETMLATRSAPGAGPTLYPIPQEARPLLLALRRLMAGDAAAIATEFATGLAAGEKGWRLDLRPRGEASGPSLVARGCGGDLAAVEITGRDGVRRRLAFSRAE